MIFSIFSSCFLGTSFHAHMRGILLGVLAPGDQLGHRQAAQQVLLENAFEVRFTGAVVERLVGLDDQDGAALAHVEAAAQVAAEIPRRLRVIQLMRRAQFEQSFVERAGLLALRAVAVLTDEDFSNGC